MDGNDANGQGMDTQNTSSDNSTTVDNSVGGATAPVPAQNSGGSSNNIPISTQGVNDLSGGLINTGNANLREAMAYGISDDEAKMYIANKARDEFIGRKYRTMNSEPASREQLNRIKKKISSRRAMQDAIHAYNTGIKKKMARRLKNARPISSLGRTAAGATIGATFGALGLAAGIASGDGKNVMQNTGAAMIGGFKLGSDSYNAYEAAGNVQGIDEVYERTKLGSEEYRKKQEDKYYNKIATDESTITMVQEAFGGTRKEAEKTAKLIIPEMGKAGLKDVGDMIKAEKFYRKNGNKYKKKDGTTLSRSEAAQLPRLVATFNAESKTSEKGQKELLESMQNVLGVNEETAKRFRTMTNDYIRFKNQ